ncbi:MAG: alpha/beta fold hydrolase, partial [Pseudomonas sp.]
SAPWNFEPEFVEEGKRMLREMPYNLTAVEWSDKNFDHTYTKQWWPLEIPTLIVSGERDRIVAQDLWVGSEFEQSNVRRFVIPNAGHFPWIENPFEVRSAFTDLSERIDRYRRAKE